MTTSLSMTSQWVVVVVAALVDHKSSGSGRRGGTGYQGRARHEFVDLYHLCMLGGPQKYIGVAGDALWSRRPCMLYLGRVPDRCEIHRLSLTVTVQCAHCLEFDVRVPRRLTAWELM